MNIGGCPVKRTTSAFLTLSFHWSSRFSQTLWCSLWFLSLLSLTCSTDPQHKHIIFTTPFSHHLQGPTDFSSTALNKKLIFTISLSEQELLSNSKKPTKMGNIEEDKIILTLLLHGEAKLQQKYHFLHRGITDLSKICAFSHFSLPLIKWQEGNFFSFLIRTKKKLH